MSSKSLTENERTILREVRQLRLDFERFRERTLKGAYGYNYRDHEWDERIERFEKALAEVSEPAPTPEKLETSFQTFLRPVGNELYRTVSGLTLVPLAKIAAFADCSHSLTSFREKLDGLRSQVFADDLGQDGHQ